jgi:N-acetylneuraminic acid mutarotase
MKKNFLTFTFIVSSFVAHLSAQTWSVDSTPIARSPFTVATLGSKIMVIGGNLGTNSSADIYDETTKKWTSGGVLSFRDFKAKAIPLGNKIYCFQGIDTLTNEFGRNLDIYNTATNTWQRDSLTFIPNDVGAGTIGSKLFIAGGLDITQTSSGPSNVVRIYDTVTQKWTYTASLSVARRDIQVIKVKNKLLFIGGFSENPQTAWDWTFYKNIDIYDEITGKWSTVFMKTGRLAPAVTVSGSKVLIVGGINRLDFVAAFPTLFYTKSVEIYDVDTDTWQTADLPKPRVLNGIATYDKKAYLISGYTQDEPSYTRSLYKKVDVYNFTTNTWTEQAFPAPDSARNGITIGLKNKIYFMGGTLENSQRTKRVDILTLPPSSIFEPTVLPNKLAVFPNPTSDELTVDFDKQDIAEYSIKIANTLGQTVYNQQGIQVESIKIDLKNLNKGIYFLTVNTPKGIKNQTFIKQ